MLARGVRRQVTNWQSNLAAGTPPIDLQFPDGGYSKRLAQAISDQVMRPGNAYVYGHEFTHHGPTPPDLGRSRCQRTGFALGYSPKLCRTAAILGF